MIVTFVWIGFGDAQGKEREREKLEDFRNGGCGRYFREERIFRSSGSIRGGLDGAEGAFYFLQG